MKRFISFGSIEQFRTVIKNVQWMSQYKGKDENDDVIMDRTAKSPKITAVASEKIHGTNAAVCYSNPDGFWVQSRKNIITPEKDNAACAFQVTQNEDEWMRIINDLSLEHDIDLDKNIISVYFEWCGGNIQKKACVTGLDKMAIIFRHFKVSPLEPQVADDGQETAATWHETCEVACGARDLDWVECKDKNIFNVMNFPTVELEIDFDASGPAQNKMIELTEAVEKDSGIAKAFDMPENIGEGWVWTFIDDRGNLQRWKTKGDEHAKGEGKIKKLTPVDTEKEQKKIDFVNDVACIEGRLEQMRTEIIHSKYNGEELKVGMQDVKDFLGLVFRDVIKEHSDEMAEAGLEPKQINGLISKVAVTWFKSKV